MRFKKERQFKRQVTRFELHDDIYEIRIDRRWLNNEYEYECQQWKELIADWQSFNDSFDLPKGWCYVKKAEWKKSDYSKDIIKWLHTSCNGKFMIRVLDEVTYFFFELENDALLFKLTWC